MSVEVISIIALIIAIAIGSFKKSLNTGLIAITFAYIIGLYFIKISYTEVTSYFPSDLFLTIFGITLFFHIAKENRTLNTITNLLLDFLKYRISLLPFLFFILAFLLSAIGAGNIASVAIIASIAMPICTKLEINPVLMAIMVCTGANAGSFSPFAPTGIISIFLLEKINYFNEDLYLSIFLITAFIQSLTAVAAYFIFKGYKSNLKNHKDYEFNNKPEKITKEQKITLLAIAMLLFLVVYLKIQIGLGALLLSFILSFFNLGNQKKAIKSIPWNPIFLIVGITVLIEILKKSGGLSYITSIIGTYSTKNYINSMLAFLSGLVSVYSSSSAVVMPTFVSLIPELAQKVVDSNITNMIIAINVGSHLVDVSPLSTLGAICIASFPEQEKRNLLFRRLLLWGLMMALVGGILAFLFLDLPEHFK